MASIDEFFAIGEDTTQTPIQEPQDIDSFDLFMSLSPAAEEPLGVLPPEETLTQETFLDQELGVESVSQPEPVAPLGEQVREPLAPPGVSEPSPGFGTVPQRPFSQKVSGQTPAEAQRELFTKFARGLGPRFEEMTARGEFQKVAEQGLKVATDENLTLRQWIQQSDPNAIKINAVEQKLTSVARGMTGTLGGFMGFGAYLFDSDVARDMAVRVNEWERTQLTGKEDIFDDIARAGGSSAAFWIPGFGISSALSQVAKVGTNLARWAGAITSATVEGMAEAGGLYNEILAETGSKIEAERAARTVFLGNIPISVVTNRLGVFADKGGAIKRKLLSAVVAEIPQEVAQETLTKAVKTGERITLPEVIRTAVVTAPVALFGGGLSTRLLPGETATLDIAEANPEQINRAIGPTGEERLFRYQVKDLSELQPTTGTSLQRRQRGRETSQAQVAEIARTFSPDLALEETLSLGRGTIITAPDNRIISGHGRRQAILKLQRDRPEAAAQFKEEVKRRAPEFGLAGDPKLESAEIPVIVREALPDQDIQVIADESNVPEVAGFSSGELVAQISDQINPQWLQNLVPLEGGLTDTIESPTNRMTIRNIVNLLPIQMQNEFRTSGGQLSKNGLELVRAAIFTKAYKPGVVLTKMVTEETDPGIKNVLKGMLDASPKVVAVNTLPRADLDIAQDLTIVAEKMNFAKKQGVKVEDIINQRDFINELTPLRQDILRAFEENKRSAPRVRDIIERYYNEVAKEPDANQLDLLGRSPATKDEILNRALQSEQTAFLTETELPGVQEQQVEDPLFTAEGLESIDPTLEQSAEAQEVPGPVETVEPTPRTPDTMPKIIHEDETGAVPLEPLVKGLEALESAKVQTEKALDIINRMFTRHVGLDEQSRQAFINLEEGQTVLRRQAAKISAKDYFTDPVTGKIMSRAKQDALYKHLQEPELFAAPEGTKELADRLHQLSKWSFIEINNTYLNTKKDKALLRKVVLNGLPIPDSLIPKLKLQRFPDTAIKRLQEQRNKIIFRLQELQSTDEELLVDIEPSLNPELEEQLLTEINQIDEQINRLETVVYFHQITDPIKPFKKVVGRRTFKSLSKNPRAFLGRKYATRQDAIEAGRVVAPLDTAVADTIYETNKTIQTDHFIKAINRNPDFSARSDVAPDDWVSIDERLMPSGKFRKYNPAVARAIEELTYAGPNDPYLRAMDRLNSSMKVIGFYNPIFMARFNVSQGIRAVGPAWVTNILPKVKIDKHGVSFAVPDAIRIWQEKGAAYDYLAKNGLFNNVFDIKPAMEDIMQQVRDVVNTTKTSEKYKRIALNQLKSPQTIAYNTWKTLNESTWKIDEVQRINTWLLMQNNPRLKRHYSDFEIIELANDFHANYGKIPKVTRKFLNRAIFTPSYKVSMARIVGRMHREPKQLWPALMRHYLMKIMFNKFLPLAVNYYLNWKGVNARTRVEGYRLIVQGLKGKKETVFSISDPLLEGTKVLNRPFNRTMEYNAAALPAALLTFARGPLFRDKDADWKDKVNSFFKVGAPVLRELDAWEKKDLETYQKFMSLLGLAFVYHRNKTEFPEEAPGKALLKAMDLWFEWDKVKPKWDNFGAKKRATKRGAL